MQICAENTLTTGGGSSYWHDALHRLSFITASSTRFTYDGDQVTGIYNASNTLLRRFVYGPDEVAPIVWYDGTGLADRRYLDMDERGSVIRVTLQNGSTMRINTYDENGVPASTNLGRFGFTGGVFLPEIGMYEFRNRVYNPSIGRFMQPDPIGTAGGPNLYAYAGADPINSIDPSGLASFTTAPGLTCGVICTGSVTSPGVAYSYLTARYSWSAPFQTSSNPVGTGATNVSAFGPGFDNSQGYGALHQLVADAPVFHFRARPGGASNQPSGFAGIAAAGPQNTNNNLCGRKNDWADAANYVLNFAGTTADAASLALAGASLKTGGLATPVGESLAFGAAVANRVSAATSGLQIPINLSQGNYRGALANVAGLIAGHFAADLVGKGLGTTVSGLKKDATNTAASQAASNASGC